MTRAKPETEESVAVRLYFFFRPGCPACEEGDVELRAFMRRNPGTMIIRLNADMGWEIRGWSAKSTPGYLLVADEEKIGHRVGAQTDRDLVRWLRENGLPVR